MDESALRILVANLEGSRSSLHGWLEFWTVLVVIGVVLDVVFVIWECVENLQDFRRGTIRPPGRPNLLLLVLGLLGATLVAVGVSGELYEETKIEHVETQIRTANDELYLLLSKEAGDAEATAKGFDAKIAESTARVKAAEAIISTADARIAEAQRDASESKKEAESERLARVTLQKELEPRRLTGVQKDKLRSLLSADPQQIMFGWCMTGSDDCQDFVNDIGDAFNKAGWKTWFAASTRNKRGIRVGFMKGSDDKLAAHWVPKIRNALAEVGLSSEEAWFDPNDRTLVGGFQKNILYLIVGQKPAIKTTTANDNSQ